MKTRNLTFFLLLTLLFSAITYSCDDGVDIFCEKLIKQESVLLLPSKVYNSDIVKSAKNHFRIGYGNINMSKGLELIKKFINKNYNK